MFSVCCYCRLDYYINNIDYRRLDEGWDLEKVRKIGDRIVNDVDDAHYMDRGDEHPHRIVLGVQAHVARDVIKRVQRGLEESGV